LSIILTLSVVITWLALSLAFSALGGLFFHRIGRIESTCEHLYYGIWAGMALTVLVLMLWHFVLPVSAAIIAFTLLSVVAVIVEREWLKPLLVFRSHRRFALIALTLVTWTANHSLSGGGMDDYNYEFQAVRWFFEHPLVPGLANLHGRLGFNNSHHLLAALISAAGWAGHVNHIVNGFVVSLVLVYVLAAVNNVAAQGPESDPEWLFGAFLLAPAAGLVLFGIFGPAISTLKADIFVTAGVIVFSAVFVAFASSHAATSRYRVTAATLVLAGCLLTTVKLSAAAYCGTVVLAVLIRMVKDRQAWVQDASARRLFACAVGAAVVMAAGFLARGVLLSGYPLYPSSAFGLDVDWRVPLAQVNADRVFIKTWSQLRPTYDMASTVGHEWFSGWLNSLILTQKLSIILPLAQVAILAPVLLKPGQMRAGWALRVLAAASFVALVVWFTQAPAARFAAVYFWIPLASMIVWGVRGRAAAGKIRASGAAAVSAVAVALATGVVLRYARIDAVHDPGILAVVAFAASWGIAFVMFGQRFAALVPLCLALGLSQIGERAAAHALRGRMDEIGAMAWLNIRALPREPEFEHVEKRTRSGLTVFVSKSVSFHTPIPNTRYFNPYLEARTPGDLRGGFRNPADAAVGYGYTVDYVIQPNAGMEIVVPAGE